MLQNRRGRSSLHSRSAIATRTDCVAHCCLVRINNTWHYAFNLKTSKCILKWNTVYHIKGTNVDILFGWVQAGKQQQQRALLSRRTRCHHGTPAARCCLTRMVTMYVYITIYILYTYLGQYAPCTIIYNILEHFIQI